MAAQLVIRDPRHEAREHGILDRIALRFINDERDLPFIHLSLAITLVLLPFAVLLFVPGVFRWWLGVAYLALNAFVFMDRFILMLHNTSHRPLFKRRFRLLNKYIPWVIGPLFGETPDTYFAHHVGMHHPEENLEQDLSSTMRFQRDRLDHFLRYWGRFFFLAMFELGAYHFRRKRWKLLRMMIVGEVTWYLVVVGLMFVSWEATLVVLVIPYVMVRFLMMAGNWSQHAFIDAADPADPYKASIVCINSRYNRRCFNDGYHIGHHQKPTMHWTDMPADFEDKREEYVEHDTVVFEGIDYFVIWVLLMLRRYDRLADHFVELRESPRSRDEVLALLRERTRRIPSTA